VPLFTIYLTYTDS